MLKKGLRIIMKTVTDVNTVNQLLTYSKQAEAGIHQKAIQMLLGAGKHTYYNSIHFKCIFGEYEAGT